METYTQQQGWLKLFYRFSDWEWYGDPNMVALFIHLLLKANYKPVRRRGVVYDRGTVVTSREMLSHETGLSQRTIRTCLNRLKSTNEITIKSTMQGSVITLTNYDKYQGQRSTDDQQNDLQVTNGRPATDQQSTDNRPASDRQTTGSKEIKNIKKEKTKEINNNYNNNRGVFAVVDGMSGEAFLEDFFSTERQGIVEQLCAARGFGTVENLRGLARAVVAEWEALAEPPHDDLQGARRHLINHCARKMAAGARGQQTDTISLNHNHTNNHTSYDTRYIDPAAEAKRQRQEDFAKYIYDKINNPRPKPELFPGFN